MLNKEFLKRASSYLNSFAMVVASCMVFIPDLGLSSELTAKIMLACTLIVQVAQMVSFKRRSDNVD